MADTLIDKIVFDFDNDNRPMRESVAKGTLFEPQYKQALRQIDAYLGELDLEKTEEDRDRSIKKSDTEFIPDDIDYNNNIFSFIGDRGTGKTSCMISVASMLKEKENIDRTVYPHINKIKFTTIDLIDPAYFDKSHNLLSLFLAKLYKKYSQRVEMDVKMELSRSNKQEFLECYRDAHAQLHRLYTGKDKSVFSDEDLMEYVEDVSASVKLKRTIQDLVDAYLKCFGWKDTILILRVDDVDMDIHHASEMIESMRKYFVQPNLLVFVSCDIDQLEKIKSGDFKKELQDKEIASWHQELADRYLAKVFPHSHRIQMPAPASYHNQALRIRGDFSTEAGLEVPEKERTDKKNYRDFVSVKQAVPELILKKTRYLFYNTNYYESYIVPGNLRELRQLMKLLITMPDYNKKLDAPKHNKTLFKEYFFNTWVSANLGPDDQKLVSQILSVRDISLFNKSLLRIMKDRFVADRDAGIQQVTDLFQRLETSPLPASTSDVLSVISAIEPALIQEKDRKLVFFIKSYYSIMLYDTYREVLRELDFEGNRSLERRMEGVDGKVTNPIIRRDPLSEFYDFEKLVGGTYLQLNNNQGLTVLNTKKLREYVQEAKKLCAKDTLNNDETAKVLLTELMVLSIHFHRPNSASTAPVDLYEQFKSISDQNEQAQEVVSVGALLFNLTRYWQSIHRYDVELYKAIAESRSYKNIYARIAEKERITNYYGWLNCITLRNFEVLQDIKVRFNTADYSSAPELFFEELKYLADYSFPLYEHPEGDEEHNNISLAYLKCIIDGVIKLIEDRAVIDDLFGNTSKQAIEDKNVTGSTQADVSGAAGEAAAKVA